MSAGSALSLKPATNVVSMFAATQCAAVSIRSPAVESSTAPVHVCRSPAPRNTAPILGCGGTGAAVILVVVAATLVGCGSAVDPRPQAAASASSPIISAAEYRIQ